MAKIDVEKTNQLRKDLMESYERLFNSPGMQLLSERDKGIHPTTHDKSGTKIIREKGHYKVVDR